MSRRLRTSMSSSAALEGGPAPPSSASSARFTSARFGSAVSGSW